MPKYPCACHYGQTCNESHDPADCTRDCPAPCGSSLVIDVPNERAH